MVQVFPPCEFHLCKECSTFVYGISKFTPLDMNLCIIFIYL